jgi:hypothetical protein
MLEIGPGTGYYPLPVAARLGPAGVLEILESGAASWTTPSGARAGAA